MKTKGKSIIISDLVLVKGFREVLQKCCCNSNIREPDFSDSSNHLPRQDPPIQNSVGFSTGFLTTSQTPLHIYKLHHLSSKTLLYICGPHYNQPIFILVASHYHQVYPAFLDNILDTSI